MGNVTLQDVKIYTCGNLEEAERARKLLMAHDPRPCVYVYPINPQSVVTGYEVNVANHLGGHPSDKFVATLKAYLKDELGKQ